MQAQAALDAGAPSTDYVEEIARLERAVQVAPSFVRAATTLASIHRYLFLTTSVESHLDAARSALANAERAAPGNPSVTLQQIELLNATDRSDEALSLARKLVSQRPGNEAAWRHVADSLKLTGDLAGAERAYLRAYALQPSWYALWGLGDIRMLRGDYSGSESALEELLLKAPTNVTGMRKLGELRMNSGRFRDCEAIYREIIARTKSVTDRVNLGTCLYFQGHFDEAAENFSEVASKLPGDPLPVANLADALLASGRRGEALEKYAAALSLCDQMLEGPARRWGLLRTRARCQAQLGQYQAAQETISTELADQPSNQETVFVAALIASLAGDPTSCVAWTRRALDLRVPPIWFGGPEFASMRQNPEFRRLFPGNSPPVLEAVSSDP